jgi:TolB protein
MNKLYVSRRSFGQRLAWSAAGLCLWAGSLRAQTGEETLVIPKEANPASVIPVAVAGFSGEVDQVIRFDLEVLGCEIVPLERAVYLVQGSNSGNVQGALMDARTKASLLAKAYTGGTLRAQAHAFANDVILSLRGTKPIFHTQIAFKVDRGPVKEICVSDFDGHNVVAITRDNSITAAPCWRPGARQLYYVSYKEGFPAIYLHDLNAGVRRPVARHAGSNISPAVSHDGKLALILSKGGSPNLYVADAEGQNLRKLTNSREGESSPCWSPDGKYICYASRQEGGRGLYVVNAASGEVRRLRTALVSNATEPDWSPDGKWIAFTTQTGPNSFEVCVVPAEGGEALRLAPGEDPSWAPNSRTLVIARRTGNGNRVLSLLDVPTKRVKDAHQVGGSASQPSWAR